MTFVNSIVQSATMEHPNKRTVRKRRCYKCIHKNMSFFCVHIIACSRKSVVLLICLFYKCAYVIIKSKYTFKIHSELRIHSRDFMFTVNSFTMCCAIWYHLCNLKNVKNTHGGVLLMGVLHVF